jgi:O-antigen ligase/polysaccharide polymerase Wzy-like membrane protein
MLISPVRARVRLPRPGLVVPVTIALTIFAIACGSSSVRAANDAGKTLRWVALFLLLGVAVLWAFERIERPALRALVLVPAVALLALALISSLWSVDWKLSAARAVSVVVLFATAGLLAHAAATRRDGAEHVLIGIAAGAALVALAGLVVLVFDHATAVQAATPDVPARYKGFGESPNMAPLLLAVCLPVVVGLALRAQTWRRRVVFLAIALLLVGSIIPSGSRGALAAGFVGVLVVVALAPLQLRSRLLILGATVAVFVASVALAYVPKSLGPAPPSAHAPSAPTKPPRYANFDIGYPLDIDDQAAVGTAQQPVRRTFFGLSGRGIAWRGAVDQANERPVAGYGFGTERRVFVDRYTDFASGLVENSYVGMYLQLGAVGLLIFCGLLLVIVVSGLLARARWEVAVALGAVVVGIAIAFVQSFAYSAGDIAALTFWTCGFIVCTRLVTERA